MLFTCDPKLMMMKSNLCFKSLNYFNDGLVCTSDIRDASLMSTASERMMENDFIWTESKLISTSIRSSMTLQKLFVANKNEVVVTTSEK